MKIRWRQQEIILVTIIISLLFINFFQHNILISREEITDRGQLQGFNNNIPFTYLYSYILPQILPALVLYIFYLILNLYIIPILILRKKIFALAVITGIAVWCILLGVYAISYYRTGIFAILRSSGLTNLHISLHQWFSITGLVFVLYAVYAYIREWLIKKLSKDKGNRPFRIMLVNNITASAFTYLAVFFLLYIFEMFRNDGMAIFYLFFLLPTIIICFINVYGIFPRQHRYAASFKKIVQKLLIAPLILTIAGWLFFSIGRMSNVGFTFPVILFTTLVLIATPISWLLYVLQRDRLSEMLHLQKNLGKTSADLQFLRSQINPHFLFNALNTIYGTALQENADRTAEAVQKLGDMMRFMLEENQQDKIALSKELGYLSNYIELQKLRTQVSSDIDISFTTNTTECHHEIAPMLLIPFVENAFKHGISLKEKSWIKINISCNTEQVYFDVYNSVHPRKETDPEKNRSGIGLENVKQRLSLLYPQQHELQIRSTATEYFVHLTIKP